jgi:chromosomal replication initiation ATPase DnaA
MSYTNSTHGGNFGLQICSLNRLYRDSMEEELRHEDMPGYGQLLPILNKVGGAYRMTLPAMLHGKTPTPVEARQVCCWLAQQLGLRLSNGEIAQVMRRRTSMIGRYVTAIEEQRKRDPHVLQVTERLLNELRPEYAAP